MTLKKTGRISASGLNMRRKIYEKMVIGISSIDRSV